MLGSSDGPLLNNLLDMSHVVGYHLPISPYNYQVEIMKAENDNTVAMISHFDVSPKNACCIPFSCLLPLCKQRKQVIDHFYVDEEASTLTLESTNAFCGLINCFEKGKVFQVIQCVEPYLILVNTKEIFILSTSSGKPTKEDQGKIRDAIGPSTLPIKYL